MTISMSSLCRPGATVSSMSLRARLLTGTAGVVAMGLTALAALADPLPPGLSCTGSCGTLGANGVVSASPFGSSSYFYVTTSGGQTGAGQLPGVGGTNGSLLSTDFFQATAGSEVNYFFNYVTSDGSQFADYGFSQLVGSDGSRVTLFSARTRPSGDISPGFGLPTNDAVLTPATTQIQSGTAWSALGGSSGSCYAAGCGHTGWVSATYVIPQTGLYRLVFGVSNFLDTAFDSGLAFDGLTVDGGSVFGCVVTDGNDNCLINAATNQSLPINGLGGTDTLRVAGTVNFNFDVSRIGTTFTNFEQFAKAGTAVVTLTGIAGVAANWTIESGKLLAGGDAFAPGSTLTVLAGGVFGLNSNLSLAALSGSGGGIELGSHVLTVGASGDSTSFGGTILGTGKLVKTGSGILTLSGANGFSGGIDILGGGIRLGSNGAAGTGPITTFGSLIDYADGVNNAAPVIIASNTTKFQVLSGTAEQSGIVSQSGGARPFEKLGAGELVLSAANSFTGNTTVSNGRLTLRGGSALGDAASVSIAAPGSLRIASSETIGMLAGSGALVIDSGRVLTLGGTNANGAFAGSSSGAGGLSKTGAGNLDLTGAHAFGGMLDIAQGRVSVLPGGSLSGMSLSVAPGASLFMGASAQGTNGGGASGSGLGSMSVGTGGTLYLDDNATLGGSSLTLAAGSNLNLFLTTSTTTYPRVTASSAAISGSKLGIYLDPVSFGGTSQILFTYDNVIASSNVTGTFASTSLLQSPSPLFQVSSSVDAGGVDVKVLRLAFNELISNPTGNQSSVGSALERIFVRGVTDPDLLNLVQAIGSGSLADIIALYNSVSGPVLAEVIDAVVHMDDPFKQIVAERINIARTPGCTVAGESWCLRRYAQATPSGPVMSDIQGDPAVFDWLQTGVRDTGTVSVWGRALGAWSTTDGAIDVPGSRQRTFGLVGGVDRVFNATLLAGVAGQYLHSDLDFMGGRDSASVEALQLGSYVSYGGADVYVNGTLSVMGAQASKQRFMRIGTTDYALSSFGRSWTASASAEVGRVYEVDGLRMEPSAGLSYAWTSMDPYAERGGGGLGLTIRPESSHSLRSVVGARVSRPFDLGDRKVVPQLKLEWRHELLDRGQSFEAAFNAAPDVPFRVEGSKNGRDELALGASVTVPIAGNVTGYADVQTAFSDDRNTTMVSVGIRATW